MARSILSDAERLAWERFPQDPDPEVIGVIESLVGTYGVHVASWMGGEFSLVTPYLVMMIVLLVRPFGLFGTREVVRI